MSPIANKTNTACADLNIVYVFDVFHVDTPDEKTCTIVI